jgi:hypothetical protein
MSMEGISTPSKQRQPIAQSMRPLSPLESLPTEIIQKIFFHSIEVNLARASPIFSRCLTSESIYRICLLYSFFDENTECKIQDKPLGKTITKAFRPAEYHTLDGEERRRLQAAVLDCRWCTYDRVKACLPEVLRLTVHSVWAQNGVLMEKDESSRLNTFDYEELEQGRATSEGIRPFVGVDERDNQEMTLEIFSTFSIEINKEEDSPGSYDELGSQPRATQNRARIFHPVTCFLCPSKLLCEPWTMEKIRFFHLLRKHRGNRWDADGASLEDSTVARQSVQRAINNAIRKTDLDFMIALLILDKIFHETIVYHYRKEKFQNIPYQYTISPDHFKVAITQPENSIQTLRLLIKFDSRSLPWWDSDLQAWARKQDNSFGRTLLRVVTKHEIGNYHMGRDLAMLMLDENGSNAQKVVARRAEVYRSKFNSSLSPDDNLDRREVL